MTPGARRRAAWIGAALLVLLPRLVAAQANALAVRTVDPTPRSGAMTAGDRAARTARFEAALAALPVSPRTVRALLPSRPEHPLGGWYVIELADAAARDAALAALARPGSGCVAELLRDIPLAARGAAVPADDVPGNILQVRAPEAVALVTPDTTIVVAVVDTGSDLEHPDLVRRLWRNDDPPGNADPSDDITDQNGDGQIDSWERDDDDDNGYVDDEHGFDFTDAPGKGGFGDAVGRDPNPSDDDGHGTHVAGILCADGALRGVAPFVQLMTLRAAYGTTFGGVLEVDDAAAAIVYAADNGARILNLSWGDQQESRLVHEAIAYAQEQGVLVVGAAGNGSNRDPHWPSGQAGVLGVGAVDAEFTTASFSNHGPGVAITAPGERASGAGGGILSLAPGGGRATRRGTSMAAPHVAGAAAIVMSRAERPDAETTRASLLAGARRATDAGTALQPVTLDALGAVQSIDPLRIEVAGHFRRSILTLIGTVTGGDLARWKVDAQGLEGGGREIAGWRTSRVVDDTLVVAGFETTPESEWQWILTVENGHGGRTERRGAFTIDHSPPSIDSLGVAAVWRGAERGFLFSAAANEPVTVVVPPAGAAPGFDRFVQLELAQAPTLARFQNAVGLETQVTVSAGPALPGGWPRGAGLVLASRIATFRPSAVSSDGPARPVVWGNGLDRSSPPRVLTVQAWGMDAGALVLEHDTGVAGRPVAAADANGDGAADLLLQTSFRAVWLHSTGAGTFADSIAADIPTERVLGFFQLDGDAPFEAILSSRDTLYLHDDGAAGDHRRTHTLPNPNRSGFNVFGGTAAVGDLDGDGRTEIACGDAEGWVAIYEQQPSGEWPVESRLDTGGTYAYEIAPAPTLGFVVGCQRTTDPGGDSFATAIYDFQLYAPSGVPGTWTRSVTLPFLSPQNDLRAAVVPSPDGRIAIVRGPSLGLGRWTGNAFSLDSYLDDADATGGAVGEPPAIVDLDGDAALDIVLRTPEGATLLELDPTGAGPFALTSESLGAGLLSLAWQTRGGNRVRVRRGQAGSWQTLGETTASTWIDSAATNGVAFEYEVQAFEAGVPGAASNRIRAHSQPLPRFLGVGTLGPAGLRIKCSNPLRHATATANHWTVTAAARTLRVLEATLAAGGREVHLLLAEPLACVETFVTPVGVRDEQGGRLAGNIALFPECETAAPFAVETVGVDDGAVVVRFNRAVDAATVLPQRFALSRAGVPVPIATADAAAGTEVRLGLAPPGTLVGRGDPYRLRIDAAVRAAGDGAALAYDAIEYAVWVDGAGAASVVPVPNPVRPGDGGVLFSGASTTTRIDIYDLQGERVRTLDGAVGGGLRWDLRAPAGGAVAPGTYLYVARDGATTRTGHVVILR